MHDNVDIDDFIFNHDLQPGDWIHGPQGIEFLNINEVTLPQSFNDSASATVS